MMSDPPAGTPDSGRLLPKSRGQAPDAALAGRYHARGVEHDIYVVRLTSLRWQVLDVTPTHVRIVDSLEGYDDRLEQARALASDYVRHKQTHHQSHRDDDPLPRRSGTARHDDNQGRS